MLSGLKVPARSVPKIFLPHPMLWPVVPFHANHAVKGFLSLAADVDDNAQTIGG